MTARFAALCFALALAASLAGPVGYAQPQAPAPGTAEPDKAAPDKGPREARPDRGKSIDFPFEALKAAPEAETAKLVENRIWALRPASGSGAADLPMTRVQPA